MQTIKKIVKKSLVACYRVGLRLFGGLGLQKIWPLGAIRDWLSGAVRTYNKPNSVIFRGHTIFLDPNDNLELSVWGNRHGASREIELMEQLLHKGDTAVDVGANIGLMTVFMAKAVGTTGRVFAFEPGPENMSLLQQNIAVNHYNNVTVTPAAVSGEAGTLKLFLSDFNPGDHRIYNPEEKTKDWVKNDAVYDKLVEKRTAIDVSAVSLDEFFSAKGGSPPEADGPSSRGGSAYGGRAHASGGKDYKKPIAFIKMDVQGAEGGVLKGMMGILQKNHNVKIITEFWPAGLEMFGVGAAEFLTSLENLGFSFYEIEKYALKKPTSKNSLLQKYTIENNKSCNLFVSR